MVSRKRDRAEMESVEPPKEMGLLDQLRNTWQFANLMQYIFIFGRAVKIDEDFTIDDLETECLKPQPSEKLLDIGLALLKNVSSHRGLTPDIFDEYTRRQYVAKAPQRNPFGTDETPKKFADFDIFTKLRVLFQLSQWTLLNPDRIREKMPEAKDTEQTNWRIEEVGYDKEDRLYYVLDDNRLYRRTDPPPPPPPPPKPKANSRRGKAAARANKRRKTMEAAGLVIDDEGGDTALEGTTDAFADDGFGGRKWECIAITLAQYQEFLRSIEKSKDEDERALHARITAEVLPVIEKAEESQLRRIARKEKELINMQRLATAKRSSRLANKMEREREEQEALEAERRRKAELLEAKKDQERQKKMEEARESRMMTREQRLKDREYKRILQEEELASLSEDNKKVDAGEARMSERHLKAEMEKRKKELAALAQEDEWSFDCSKCGVYGDNLDDGSHSVACEKCNVWQHSACLGISQAEAEEDNFHFICHICQRRAEDAKKPKIPALKFHLGSSSSPPSQKTKETNINANVSKKRKPADVISNMPPMKKFKSVEIANPLLNGSGPARPLNGEESMRQVMLNGPTLSPQGQIPSSFDKDSTNPSPPPPPPPGLRESSGRPVSSNGYGYHTHRGEQRNGFQVESTSASLNTAAQVGLPVATNQGTEKSSRTGWSARYRYSSSHMTTQLSQRLEYSPTVFCNPFLDGYVPQRPASSHAAYNVPSPTKNPSSLPSSHVGEGGIFNPMPHVNGIAAAAAAVAANRLPPTAPQLPQYSPIKQQSSPPMPAIRQQSPASPNSHHFFLQQNAPSSPGFSPTKHSPPRSFGGAEVTNTPVLPPVENLSPSPQVSNPPAPVKLANGDMHVGE